jgi:soluble lytic murein transglycosylase-like protein
MRTRIRLLTLGVAAALAVPTTASAAAPPPAGVVTHTVRGGETLTSVAATDGLTVAELATANGLSTTAELTAGTELVIPPQGGATVAATPDAVTAPSTAAAPTSDGGYVVRRGDTLTAIAARYGTTPAALAAGNDLSLDGLLLTGRTLTLTGVAAPAPSDTVPAPAPSSEFGADEFVSPSQVGEIAEQGGVSASLAEAIADQESGFNDAEVSSTGAVGVMQIEPQTWRDLSQLDGLDLSADSALDNVRGGVAVLRSLLAQTGGDESEAIAGYYQGLASVRAQGMFADTQRYVRDVLALQDRFGG